MILSVVYAAAPAPASPLAGLHLVSESDMQEWQAAEPGRGCGAAGMTRGTSAYGVQPHKQQEQQQKEQQQQEQQQQGQQ